MNLIKRPIRFELIWVGLGQGLAALGSIIGVRFLTNAMTPDTYGQLALGMTAATLLNQTIFGPLLGAILRFFSPALESHQLDAYLRSVSFLLKRATAIVIFLVCCATIGLLLTNHPEVLVILWLTVGYALVYTYCQAMDCMQNAARQRVIVAWHDGVAPLLRSMMAVAMIALLGSYSQVAMLGYLFASLLILGSQSFFFSRGILKLNNPDGIKQKESSNWTRQMLTYAWPFATWGVFYWAFASSDRWALQLLGNTTMVGFFAILYQLGYYPLMLLSGLFVQLVAPILFSWAGPGDDPHRMKRVWRATIALVSWIIVLSLAATVFAYLAHDFIFNLLVAPEYRVVSPLLPGMVLAGGLFAAGQAASLFMLSNTSTRILILPKIITSLLGIGFNIAGALLGGVEGVVLGSLLFSVIYCLWILWVARNFAKTISQTEKIILTPEKFPVRE